MQKITVAEKRWRLNGTCWEISILKVAGADIYAGTGQRFLRSLIGAYSNTLTLPNLIKIQWSWCMFEAFNSPDLYLEQRIRRFH